MQVLPDKSWKCDKWDIRAMFEITKKFGNRNGSFSIDEINNLKEYMMKSFFHRAWFRLKYPFPRFGETLYRIKNKDEE